MRKFLWIAAVAAVLAVGAGIASGSARAGYISTTLTVNTDASWTLDGSGAAAIVDNTCLPGYGSWGWTAALAPASWIWAASCTAGDTESHAFSKSFDIPADATITSASIAFAADNFGTASVNGTQLIDETGDGGWNFRDWQSADAAAAVHPGSNTILLSAWNMPNGSALGWGNPAGAVSSLTVTYQQCNSPAAPAIAVAYELAHNVKASSPQFKKVVNGIALKMANGDFGRDPCAPGYYDNVIAAIAAIG